MLNPHPKLRHRHSGWAVTQNTIKSSKKAAKNAPKRYQNRNQLVKFAAMRPSSQ